uniref:Uncharacterized protein n=1 Tax=Podospora anserina (strain S / ATCC MYA-4624 / DSM 980 / FGSC 10383) TaxID=515849 RepID=A0A090CUR8_PODAN|nr:Putative protein of unknown function [Podospora anserina S mat+]
MAHMFQRIWNFLNAGWSDTSEQRMAGTRQDWKLMATPETPGAWPVTPAKTPPYRRPVYGKWKAPKFGHRSAKKTSPYAWNKLAAERKDYHPLDPTSELTSVENFDKVPERFWDVEEAAREAKENEKDWVGKREVPRFYRIDDPFMPDHEREDYNLDPRLNPDARTKDRFGYITKQFRNAVREIVNGKDVNTTLRMFLEANFTTQQLAKIWPLIPVAYSSNRAEALIQEVDMLGYQRLRPQIGKVLGYDAEDEAWDLPSRLAAFYIGVPIPAPGAEVQGNMFEPGSKEFREQYFEDRYYFLNDFKKYIPEPAKALNNVTASPVPKRMGGGRRLLLTRRKEEKRYGPYYDGPVGFRGRSSGFIGKPPSLAGMKRRPYHENDLDVYADDEGNWQLKPPPWMRRLQVDAGLRGGENDLEELEEDEWEDELEETWFEAVEVSSDGGSDMVMGEEHDLVSDEESTKEGSDVDMWALEDLASREGDLDVNAYLDMMETNEIDLRGGGLDDDWDMEEEEDESDDDLHIRGGMADEEPPKSKQWRNLAKYPPPSTLDNASDRWSLDEKRAPTFKTKVGQLEKQFAKETGFQPGKSLMIPLHGYQGVVWFRRGIFNSFVDAVDRLLGLDSRAAVTYNLYIMDPSKDYELQEEKDAFLADINQHACRVQCAGVGALAKDRVAFNWLCQQIDKQYRPGDSAYFGKLIPFVAGPHDPIPWKWEPGARHHVGKVTLDWPQLKGRGRPDVAYLRLPLPAGDDAPATAFFTNQYSLWMQQVCRVLVPGAIRDRPGRPAIPAALINAFTTDEQGNPTQAPVTYGGLAFLKSNWEVIAAQLDVVNAKKYTYAVTLRAFAPGGSGQVSDRWHILALGQTKPYDSASDDWYLTHLELTAPSIVAERLLRPILASEIWKTAEGVPFAGLTYLEVFFPGENWLGPHFGKYPVADETGTPPSLYISLADVLDTSCPDAEFAPALSRAFTPLVEAFAELMTKIEKLTKEAIYPKGVKAPSPLSLFPQFIVSRPVWRRYSFQDASYDGALVHECPLSLWEISLDKLREFVGKVMANGGPFDSKTDHFSITQGFDPDLPDILVSPSMTETEWEVARRLIVHPYLRINKVDEQSLPVFEGIYEHQPFGYRDIYTETPQKKLWGRYKPPPVTHNFDWQLYRATPIEDLGTWQPWEKQLKVPVLDFLPDNFQLVKIPKDKPELAEQSEPPPLTRPLHLSVAPVQQEQPKEKPRMQPTPSPTRHKRRRVTLPTETGTPTLGHYTTPRVKPVKPVARSRIRTPQKPRGSPKPLTAPRKPKGAVDPRIAQAFAGRAAKRAPKEPTKEPTPTTKPAKKSPAKTGVIPPDPQHWVENPNRPGYWIRKWPTTKPGVGLPDITAKENYWNQVHANNEAEAAGYKNKETLDQVYRKRIQELTGESDPTPPAPASTSPATPYPPGKRDASKFDPTDTTPRPPRPGAENKKPASPPKPPYSTLEDIKALDTLTKAKLLYTTKLPPGAPPTIDPTDPPLEDPPVISEVVTAHKPNMSPNLISKVGIQPYTLRPPPIPEELRARAIQDLALQTRNCPFFQCYLPVLRTPETAVDHFRKVHKREPCPICMDFVGQGWDAAKWDEHYGDEIHVEWLEKWCTNHVGKPLKLGVFTDEGIPAEDLTGFEWETPFDPDMPNVRARPAWFDEDDGMAGLVAASRGSWEGGVPVSEIRKRSPRKWSRYMAQIGRTPGLGIGVGEGNSTLVSVGGGYDDEVDGMGFDGARDTPERRTGVSAGTQTTPVQVSSSTEEEEEEEEADEDEEGALEDYHSSQDDNSGDEPDRFEFPDEGPYRAPGQRFSPRTMRENMRTVSQRHMVGQIERRIGMRGLPQGLKPWQYKEIMEGLGHDGNQWGLRTTRIRPGRVGLGEVDDFPVSDNENDGDGGGGGTQQTEPPTGGPDPPQPPQPPVVPQPPVAPQPTTSSKKPTARRPLTEEQKQRIREKEEKRRRRQQREEDPDYVPTGETSESSDEFLVVSDEDEETPAVNQPGKRKLPPDTSATKQPPGKRQRRDSEDGTYKPDKETEQQIAQEDKVLEEEFKAIAEWDDEVKQMIGDGPVNQWQRLLALVSQTVRKKEEQRDRLNVLRDKKKNSANGEMSK